jgi:gluconokinase
MQQIILFGLPGAGKSFIGRLMKTTYGFTYIDGDDELPTDMKRALERNEIVTDDMRDRFMTAIRDRFRFTCLHQSRVVLSQTFLKDYHRVLFQQEFTSSIFVLVEASDDVRKNRFNEQGIFQFSDNYWNLMKTNFEAISMSHFKIKNNEYGEKNILKQINEILDHIKTQ